MCVHTCGHACKCACENQRSTMSVVHHDTVRLALLRLRLTSTWNSLSRILGWLVIKRKESDCLCLSNIPMPVFCMWLWVRNWRTHDCFLSSLLVRPTHWVQLRLLKHNIESCSHTITTPKHANVSAKGMEKIWLIQKDSARTWRAPVTNGSSLCALWFKLHQTNENCFPLTHMVPET